MQQPRDSFKQKTEAKRIIEYDVYSKYFQWANFKPRHDMFIATRTINNMPLIYEAIINGQTCYGFITFYLKEYNNKATHLKALFLGSFQMFHIKHSSITSQAKSPLFLPAYPSFNSKEPKHNLWHRVIHLSLWKNKFQLVFFFHIDSLNCCQLLYHEELSAIFTLLHHCSRFSTYSNSSSFTM